MDRARAGGRARRLRGAGAALPAAGRALCRQPAARAFHAEDVAQESFARIWLHLGDFKRGTSFKSWLFTIVRNRCIDHLRAKKPVLELDEALHVGGGDEPEPVLLGKEEWAAFRRQWGALPDDARTALYLFAVEEMRYEQIAKVLGRNTSQIKMLLHRTRKKLKSERGHEG